MRSKKAIYNIVTNIVLQIIIIIYGFIVPKIIIQTYGTNVNGLIASITQFLAYITLLESGFGPVVRAVLYKPIANKNTNEIKKILKSSERFFRKIAYVFILYIIVLCIFYPFLVASSFSSLYTISLIVIISISTFAEYFFGMTYRMFLQANQQNYIISIIQILTYILSITAIIIMASVGVSIQAIKLASAIIFVLRPILQNLYVKRKYKINLNDVDDNYKIKQKWDALSQHIAAVVNGNTDITVLTIFTNLAYVSIYSVYYLVVKGINSLIQAFNNGIDASFGDMIAKNEYENLNSKFKLYEVMCFTISTIVYTCAIILITPFVSVYTIKITDANYIQYSFGVLLVVSQYIWAIRLPYNSLIMASGHFKETRIGAWIEAGSNIIISVILVWKYGLIGVTIGTITSMIIRTAEFIYHSNKYILRRSIFETIKKIVVLLIETALIIIVCHYIPYMKNTSYLNWIINGLITGGISLSIVMFINIIIYKNEMSMLIGIIKGIRKTKKNRTDNNITNE